MRILALELDIPGGAGVAGDPDGEFGRLAPEEARRLWELVQAGIVRETHFRDDRPAAVLVLECGSIDEADEALATLPFVQAGLIRFETIGLRPYPGFARLFREPSRDGGTGVAVETGG